MQKYIKSYLVPTAEKWHQKNATLNSSFLVWGVCKKSISRLLSKNKSVMPRVLKTLWIHFVSVTFSYVCSFTRMAQVLHVVWGCWALTQLNDLHLQTQTAVGSVAAGSWNPSWRVLKRTVKLLHRFQRKVSLSLGETCMSSERQIKQTGIDQRQTGRVHWLMDSLAVCDVCFHFFLSFLSRTCSIV